VKASLSYYMTAKKKFYHFGFSFFTHHRKLGKSENWQGPKIHSI